MLRQHVTFGRYDNPNDFSSAELLVTMEEGGAIADVSASRLVVNTENVSLISSLYSCLLKKNSSGIFPRLGDAWQDTKSNNSGQIPRSFIFLVIPLFGS